MEREKTPEEAIREEEEIAVKRIPEWIERGKKLIYPEKYSKWEECVKYRAEDVYHGADLDSALEAIEKLNDGVPFDEVNAIIDSQGHSGFRHGMVMKIILNFCKNGPEFYEATHPNITEEDKKILNEFKKENKDLERKNNELGKKEEEMEI